jgi:sulfate transport system substrate-binding protein
MKLFSKPRHGGAANAAPVDARPRGGKAVAAGLVSLALAAGVAACGGSSDDSSDGGGGSGGGEVSVVAYSTPQEAYENGLEPAFNKTDSGSGVKFTNSFAASGDQSRAVEAGQPADIVHFSLEPDMTRVVDAGRVAKDWDSGEYKGIVENSVVVFVVRKGNPDAIKTWDDVASGKYDVITPNPLLSGGAKWNLMAAYGTKVLNENQSQQQGLDFIKKILEATTVQDSSARDAMGTFTGGQGDVLLAYENEAIAAQKAGEDIDYVIPDSTIKIETPLAVTTDAKDPEAANAFKDYLFSDEGQQIWADYGYRPVVQSVFDQNKDKFPIPSELFTIADLGGWDKINTDFFDSEKGKVTDIENELGVPTE